MAFETIYKTEAYVLEAEVRPVGADYSLTLQSTWPGANNPEPHTVFQVTLPKESIRQLVDALNKVFS